MAAFSFSHIVSTSLPLLLLVSTLSASRLFEECQRNSDCLQFTPNSFCGWVDLADDSPVCVCRDGYKGISGRCLPRHSCTFSGFNSALEPGHGCPSLSTQFCRGNVCLCQPGYDYNETDHCTPNRLDLGQLWRSPGLPMAIEDHAGEQEVNLTLILLIGTVFMGVMLLITITSSITAVVFFKKFHQLKLHQYQKIADSQLA